MEPFDENLSGRIREVFENYSDEGADEGWRELRKIYPPEKNRRPLIYWLSSAAAVLIVLSGIYFLNFDQTESHGSAKVTSGRERLNTIRGKNLNTPQIASEKELTNNPAPLIAKQVVDAEVVKDEHPAQPAVTETSPPNTNTIVTFPAEETLVSRIIPADSASKSPEITTDLIPASTFKLPVLAEVKTSNLDQFPLALPSDTSRHSKSRKEKRVRFAISAASFLSYAPESKKDLNLSAGLSTDIKLSRTMKLVAGASFSKQTLRFNSTPSNSTTSMLGNSAFSAIANSKGPGANVAINITGSNGFEANFFGLDLPLNFKYLVGESRHQFSIVTGISSHIFFKEVYTNTYSYNTSQMGSSLITPGQQVSSQQYSGFEPAGSFNFSLSWAFPFGKKQVVFAEPFMKLPLRGLGESNTRFGSGGLNLKVGF